MKIYIYIYFCTKSNTLFIDFIEPTVVMILWGRGLVVFGGGKSPPIHTIPATSLQRFFHPWFSIFSWVCFKMNENFGVLDKGLEWVCVGGCGFWFSFSCRFGIDHCEHRGSSEAEISRSDPVARYQPQAPMWPLPWPKNPTKSPHTPQPSISLFLCPAIRVTRNKTYFIFI